MSVRRAPAPQVFATHFYGYFLIQYHIFWQSNKKHGDEVRF